MTNEEIILKAKEEIRLRGLSPDTKPSYNSCRNRHCPKCQTLSRERCIDARKADLLNVWLSPRGFYCASGTKFAYLCNPAAMLQSSFSRCRRNAKGAAFGQYAS